jgi:acyl-coenzyme A thioesterase PaaI-like protein
MSGGGNWGFVTATVRPYFVGRTTSVWEVKVTYEEGKLVSAVRCAIAHAGK